MMKIFYALIGVVVTEIFVFVKNHQTILKMAQSFYYIQIIPPKVH